MNKAQKPFRPKPESILFKDFGDLKIQVREYTAKTFISYSIQSKEFKSKDEAPYFIWLVIKNQYYKEHEDEIFELLRRFCEIKYGKVFPAEE